MEKIYLLKKDKIMLGPYSIQNLKEKNLKASDLIWYEGLPDWTPVGNLMPFKESDVNENAVVSKPKFSFRGMFKKLFSSGK
jgi:hypothetical protein